MIQEFLLLHRLVVLQEQKLSVEHDASSIDHDEVRGRIEAVDFLYQRLTLLGALYTLRLQVEQPAHFE